MSSSHIFTTIRRHLRSDPFPVQTTIIRDVFDRAFIRSCHLPWLLPYTRTLPTFHYCSKSAGYSGVLPSTALVDFRRLNVGEISSPDYDRDPPPNGYPQPADDVELVRELLNQLITKSGKYVILVGHSSGAFTAIMVAVPEFQVKTCKARGFSGGIIGIFYECGFLIPIGESVYSFFQPKDGSETVIPPYCCFHVSLPNI